jgi:hypothetical protein
MGVRQITGLAMLQSQRVMSGCRDRILLVLLSWRHIASVLAASVVLNVILPSCYSAGVAIQAI